MVSAAGQYFGARISAADLALRTTMADKQHRADTDRANQAKDSAEREQYVRAFIEHARMVGQQMISLYNNIRTGADTGYRVSV